MLQPIQFTIFMRSFLFALLTLIVTTSFVSLSAEAPKTANDKSGKKDEKSSEEKEKKKGDSVSEHCITIDVQAISYTATAGTLPIKEENGKERASMFYISYIAGKPEDHAQRPITFSFNGGPGSSSVWLHMGILGPKRVKLDDFGRQTAPPFSLVENEYSILDKTDLVFIDPVSTGYSRAAEGKNAKDFHGVEQDVESVGEFIRLYLTRHGRWDSPVYLIGESYGTTRATALAHHLQRRRGIYLNGVMLVSSVLQFQTLRFNEGNDLPYIVFLPSYTATAWFHKKLPDSLQNQPLEAVLKRAEEFAVGEYPQALLLGDALPEAKRTQLSTRLSELTGVSQEFVKKSRLRIDAFRYFKELLREEGKTVGRFDSRFTGLDRDPLGNYPEYDPSYSDILGVFTATLNKYLREDLKYETDLPYEILSSQVHPWDYGSFKNRYLATAERLRSVMTQNPHLRVHVSSGYYDLATPYYATEYTFNTMGLHPSLKKNLTIDYYKGGHMMYLIPSELKKQREDLVKFLDGE